VNPEAGRTTDGVEARGEVRVEAASNGSRVAGPGAGVRRSRVAALMVTWNRWEMADRAISAVGRQRFGAGAIDLVVVDNGSSDGTAEELARRWRPERVVDNGTTEALEPDFREARRGGEGELNAGGFRSLTIIRNAHNLGGCGGFNTAMGYVGRELDPDVGGESIDFVWLVDDDVDLPEDALERLERRIREDERIGIVGSRTVDINDRRNTIESTIFFDFIRGRFADEPRKEDPRYVEHARWVSRVGGTRGRRELRGVREVDVVSACSMLARWSAVREVGLWDSRYFIYCDDADWCLRFGKAGYRVVCDLDAVVYHTPWNLKLTPQRLYYAQRNVIWTMRKVLEKWPLRYATLRWMLSILYQSFRAMYHRRLWHAEIYRRTARDVATGRGGRLDWEGPEARPVAEAFEAAGLLAGGKRIVVVCPGLESVADAEALRGRLAGALARLDEEPEWTDLVVQQPRAVPPESDSAARRYIPQSRVNRVRALLWVLRSGADAVVVFDQTCPLWLAGAGLNVHVDRRQPQVARVERDGLVAKARFVLRWAGTGVRAAWYVLTVRPEPARDGLS